MADKTKSVTTTTTTTKAIDAKPAMTDADAKWFENLKGILRLYENTLASSGVIRSKATDGAELTRVTRLGHARWMGDQIIQGIEPRHRDPLVALAHFGMIQGLLWGENVFPMSALHDHARQLYPEVR